MPKDNAAGRMGSEHVVEYVLVLVDADANACKVGQCFAVAVCRPQKICASEAFAAKVSSEAAKVSSEDREPGKEK